MIYLQKNNHKIDVYISKEGWNVISYYQYNSLLLHNFKKVIIEKGSNDPFIISLFKNKYYDLLIVSPMTSNTTAKIVYGIADTLITNLVSQIIKLEMNIILYPVDQIITKTSNKIITQDPNGAKFTLSLKNIDILNVYKLKKMKYVFVANSIFSIVLILRKLKNNKDL